MVVRPPFEQRTRVGRLLVAFALMFGLGFLAVALWRLRLNADARDATRARGASGASHASSSAPAAEPRVMAATLAPASSPVVPAAAAAGALVELGRRLFFDPSLSEPAGTSCASCHEPARGYAGNNGSASGVARGSRAGHFARRSTPSVLYLSFVRGFHFKWEEDAPLPDAAGGFFWDGRSDSLVTLVEQPLLNPDEMNNASRAALAAKLDAGVHATELRAQAEALSAKGEVNLVHELGRALEAFLLSGSMAPFSSKYDDFVRGRVNLAPLEAQGLELFKNPERGNCAACHHLNERVPRPDRSLFTDYGFEAVAAPRRHGVARGASDLGLCERKQPEHASEARFCGSFRTPSLRNVALRPSFMHSGTFTNLRDVVAFYATRGTDPKRWYPSGKFDDLPATYRQNVNVDRPPYDRRVRETPRLGEHDIDAIVAFLETLSDRDIPSAPSP